VDRVVRSRLAVGAFVRRGPTLNEVAGKGCVPGPASKLSVESGLLPERGGLGPHAVFLLVVLFSVRLE